MLIKQSLKAILYPIKYLRTHVKVDMNCRLYHKSKLDLLFKVYILQHK